MTRLVSAIPLVAARIGRPVIVVGGLAVICRLTAPHRATTDLDTVHRRAAGEPSQLSLLTGPEDKISGPSGVLLKTERGEVQVDVLQVTDAELDELPDDATDRLHVLSHAWAASSATDVGIAASGVGVLSVAVAEPGPLIAMKLQSVMDRGLDKQATDLLDIVRLGQDRSAGPIAYTQLETADATLRADALMHSRKWFREQAARSLRKICLVPADQDVELDDLHFVDDLLASALA